jgi:cyanophycinase
MSGVLCLNGGDEFHPGNEPQDEVLRDAAHDAAAHVLATAAAQHPEMAVRTAQGWFDGLGVRVTELRVRTRGDAGSAATAATAAGAGLFYLVGGDPGRVVRVLRGSTVWDAIAAAWRHGAALAGSSAGAMALCEWSLLRQRYPGHTRRRAVPALAIVPETAVLPHYDTFGERWIPSAQEALGADATLLGLDERTAAVWQDGQWRAMGAGAVTIVRNERRHRFSAGSAIDGLPPPVTG